MLKLIRNIKYTIVHIFLLNSQDSCKWYDLKKIIQQTRFCWIKNNHCLQKEVQLSTLFTFTLFRPVIGKSHYVSYTLLTFTCVKHLPLRGRSKNTPIKYLFISLGDISHTVKKAWIITLLLLASLEKYILFKRW